MKRFGKPATSLKLYLITVCCALAVLFFIPCPLALADESRQDTAIIMVAKTLGRLGEKDLAKRFLDDYFSNGRVKIEALGGEGVNAETGPEGLFGSGENIMTLDDSILKQADAKRIWEKRPYSRALDTVGWAVTVYHEYIHMGQKNPQNIPRDEDPAWQETDRAIARWCERLKNELDNLKNEPASGMKGDKLQELEDILLHLKSQSGLFKEAVPRNIRDGKLSAGLTWEYPGLVTKIDGIIQDVQAEITRNKSALQTTASSSGPGWKLQSVTTANLKVNEDREWYWNHKFTLSDGHGSGGLSWKDSYNSGSVSFQASWTGLSPTLLPGTKVPVVFNLSTSASQTGGYRNMGGGLYLKVNGMKIGDDVKNGGSTDSLPPPTTEKREFDVPTGKDGDVMEIFISYGNNAGSGNIIYKYVYSGSAPSQGASGPVGNGSTGGTKVKVNGVDINFDVPPVIESGRTLVPLRKIAEALGCNVKWNDTNKTILLEKGNTHVYLQVNSTAAKVNGKAKKLDVPPRITQGRTLLPLRFLAEALGLKVGYDKTSQTITISR
ncbi:MAG: copper amine oxidase N-terminal domain-containing protein [Bacillota bacterium]